MNNYDDYITGQYDSNSPINQPEEPEQPEVELTDEEQVIEQLKDRIRRYQSYINQMQKIEDGNQQYRVEGLNNEVSETYAKLKANLFREILKPI